MEKDDKGSTMIRMGVSGWMFLLVPAYPGCPGSKAVKRLLLLLSPQHFAVQDFDWHRTLHSLSESRTSCCMLSFIAVFQTEPGRDGQCGNDRLSGCFPYTLLITHTATLLWSGLSSVCSLYLQWNVVQSVAQHFAVIGWKWPSSWVTAQK